MSVNYYQGDISVEFLMISTKVLILSVDIDAIFVCLEIFS